MAKMQFGLCVVSCTSHLERRALPCLWGFDPRHGVLLLACVTGLFMAQTALPASPLELLFHIKSQPNYLGCPGPCSSVQLGHLLVVKCLLTQQAELAVIFTAMAVIIGCMANLTDTSHPKYFS